MKGRCFNRNDAAFDNYGGRGITMCDRWLKFDNFISDMGPKPMGFSIERINNNGNYEPSNCKWIPRPDQGRNRRCNYAVTIDGKTASINAWAVSLGVSPWMIYGRIKNGWNQVDAVLTPSRAKKVK